MQTDELEYRHVTTGRENATTESSAGRGPRGTAAPELSRAQAQDLLCFLQQTEGELTQELHRAGATDKAKLGLTLPPSLFATSFAFSFPPHYDDHDIVIFRKSSTQPCFVVGVVERGLPREAVGSSAALFYLLGENGVEFSLEIALNFCLSALLEHDQKMLWAFGGSRGEIQIFSLDLRAGTYTPKHLFEPPYALGAARIVLMDWWKCRISGQRKYVLLAATETGKLFVIDVKARFNPKRAYALVAEEPGTLCLRAAFYREDLGEFQALRADGSLCSFAVEREMVENQLPLDQRGNFTTDAQELLANVPIDRLYQTLELLDFSGQALINSARLIALMPEELLLRPVPLRPKSLVPPEPVIALDAGPRGPLLVQTFAALKVCREDCLPPVLPVREGLAQKSALLGEAVCTLVGGTLGVYAKFEEKGYFLNEELAEVGDFFVSAAADPAHLLVCFRDGRLQLKVYRAGQCEGPRV